MPLPTIRAVKANRSGLRSRYNALTSVLLACYQCGPIEDSGSASALVEYIILPGQGSWHEFHG